MNEEKKKDINAFKVNNTTIKDEEAFSKDHEDEDNEIEDDNETDEDKKKPSLLKTVIEYAAVFGLAYVIAVVVQLYVFIPVTVDGKSMYPTLEDSDKLIVWELGYEPERFDVAIIEIYPNTSPLKEMLGFPGESYVKRIIGLPGDYIEYKDDKLYVNGQYVEEEFLNNSGNRIFTEDFKLENICGSDCKKIPDDYYLVLGDNRPNSADSRSSSVGLISREQIIGKATMRILPFGSVGKIE